MRNSKLQPKKTNRLVKRTQVKDSSAIYWNQFKNAKQKEMNEGLLGGPEDKLAAEWRKKSDVAYSNYKRQFNKNKPGYNANGFPVTKKKG